MDLLILPLVNIGCSMESFTEANKDFDSVVHEVISTQVNKTSKAPKNGWEVIALS